jgi:uncharacterized protein YggT (Ycf19 family)
MMITLGNIARALVNAVVAIVGAFLSVRFVLKLFGANDDNGFVEWVYEIFGEILGPFRRIFPTANVEGFVIEFSTIFALMIYTIIGMLAFYLIAILTPESKN